ncbi:MAG: PfkB family carbohydrate kinase [Solirubrobacteraceae bacterium]
MRVAVVGHVEWVDFVEVPRLPRGGEILSATGAFTRAAGGGGVAAVVLAGLGVEVDFFCALGEDADGHAAADQLTERGVRVHAAWREQPTRRAVTMLERARERTIITIGERLEPLGSDSLDWEALDQAQGVYFTAGDASALEQAHRARIVTATPRARHGLQSIRRPIDALIWSGRDPHEAEWAQRVAGAARLMVETRGQEGGVWSGVEEGSWAAVAPPGPPRDSFGCGDSFAAGFTFGLAEGRSVAEAAALGAELGARCLAHVGPP